MKIAVVSSEADSRWGTSGIIWVLPVSLNATAKTVNNIDLKSFSWNHSAYIHQTVGWYAAHYYSRSLCRNLEEKVATIVIDMWVSDR
jgi:hypothetical protein